jgi:hypothetical protein
MKPANFPARKLLRQERAKARLEGLRMPVDMDPDIRHRAGRAFRDATGRIIDTPVVKHPNRYTGMANLHYSSRGSDAHLRHADDGAVMNASTDVQAEKFVLETGATIVGRVFEIVDKGFIVEDGNGITRPKKLLFIPRINLLRDLEKYLAAANWPNEPVLLRLQIEGVRELKKGKFIYVGSASILPQGRKS